MAPTPLPVTNLTGNVPVYTDSDWWYQASGFYAAPGGANPVGIHIKPRYVMPLKRLASGRYPRTINAFQAVRVLANELSHANDGAAHGGFDGGTANLPTIMKFSRQILAAAGAPKSYQRWALKRIAQAQSGRITGPPPAPVAPPPPPGTMPIIGL